MKHKKKQKPLDLFRSRLTQILDHKHPTYVLAGQIDWSVFDQEFGPTYSEAQGRPAKPIRLLVGLHYLKHMFNESDESVVARWVENPYWQYFCGFEYFQHELPLDPTTLVKWRQRVGAQKLVKLLEQTIDTAKREKLVTKHSFNRVNVDTTVQEKAIAFPTDARLYYKMLTRLIDEAKARGIKLRQSYVRKSKEALVRQSQYRKARQMKRANKQTKKLKTYLGRVMRDIMRKCAEPDERLAYFLWLAQRLLEQQRNSKNKLYSIHEPEVECIAKGKAHKRYEFGCKVGLVTTSKDGWIVGVQAFHGNPYDGHTLAESLEQAIGLTGVVPEHVYCDKGYRGHGYEGETEIHVAGMGKRKKTRTEKKWSRRRSAIEPAIGHTKHDHRMLRNYLKGAEGDKVNAVLAAAGFNMKKLLAALFLPISVWMFGYENRKNRPIDLILAQNHTASYQIC